MSAAKTKAQQLIDDNAIMVFSKSWCPYCARTKSSLKALVEELGGDESAYKIMELDQVDDGSALQDALEEITHQRSVPNIFIKKHHIGGNSELDALKSGGQLKTKVKDALAI